MVIFNASLREANKIISKYYLDSSEYAMLNKAIVNKNCLSFFNDEKNYLEALKGFLETYFSLSRSNRISNNSFLIFIIMQKYAFLLEKSNVNAKYVNKVIYEYISIEDQRVAEEFFFFITNISGKLPDKMYEVLITCGCFSDKPRGYYKKLYFLVCDDFKDISASVITENILELLMTIYDTRENLQMTPNDTRELCMNYAMLKQIYYETKKFKLCYDAEKKIPCKIINFPIKKGN